jgi:hypothetical protein
LDTEWLLSTLFDASLLSTIQPPETAAFFCPHSAACAFWSGIRRGNHIRPYRWTLRQLRAMISGAQDFVQHKLRGAFVKLREGVNDVRQFGT